MELPVEYDGDAKMKTKISILLFLTIVLFVSCSVSPKTPNPTATNTPRWFDTILSTPAILPTPPYDLHTILESSTNQTTDGKLLLYVREAEPKCHEFKNYATWNTDVVLVFLNLTNETLEIPTRFMVTISGILRSDINPYWFEQDGHKIRLSSYFIDDTPVEPYKTSVKIPGGEHYETVINIPLADHLSGTFVVKFIFHSYLSKQSAVRFPDMWTGTISANPIDICLIH